jgi:hypothetical protein
MKKSSRYRALCFACIALTAASASSAFREQPDPARDSVAACLKDFETTYGMRYRAVRILDDQGTGHRWLLVRQFDRPGAAALLLQMPDNHSCSQLAVADSAWRAPTARQKLLPVIRPGDSIILSEDSPTSDARLEAVALQPATTGEVLMVRLRLGGHLLLAVATAPGSALLADRNGARR